MFPFKNNIVLNRNTNRTLSLQLCDQVIKLIKSGKLPPASKLPGSRKLATDLGVHRKTVIASYDELISQGWIETIPAKGTFVTNTLPLISPIDFGKEKITNNDKEYSGFSFYKHANLQITSPNQNNKKLIKIEDGIPDHRLAPIDEIARTYRKITQKEHHKNLLTYGSIYGNYELRKTLSAYLNETRGMQISVDQILITRGSQMGIYLASQLLLHDKKSIIVGNTNYMTADDTFIHAGGVIEQVPVDQYGIDTKAIENLCKSKKIAAVYVTSHHHHPTTVTLSAKRRMHLLQLAKQYKFAIIEDDYDYDFHYDNAPILPLASNDLFGNVVYIGGFTKIIAPAMRIGYLIGSKDFVKEAAYLRRIIDRQGDQLLEQTLAQMIDVGDVRRHCNKVLKIYKARRDLFCSLLKEKLSAYFDFEIPNGGMAVWIRLKKTFHWDTVTNEALKQGLEITPNWKRYDNDHSGHNGIRIGFASMNEQEIHITIDKLVHVFDVLSNKS